MASKNRWFFRSHSFFESQNWHPEERDTKKSRTIENTSSEELKLPALKKQFNILKGLLYSDFCSSVH